MVAKCIESKRKIKTSTKEREGGFPEKGGHPATKNRAGVKNLTLSLLESNSYNKFSRHSISEVFFIWFDGE
jgi:hypothetical protein